MSRTAHALDKHYQWIRRASVAFALSLAVGGVVAGGMDMTPASTTPAANDPVQAPPIEGGLPH